MRTKIVLAALAVLLLPACGQGGDAEKKDAAGPAAEPAPTAEPTPTAAAAAIEGPRPGLWRVTTRFAGLPEGAQAPVTETCVTGGSQDLELPGMRGMDCTQEPFRREGGAIVGRSVCTTGERRMEADFRLTGDLSKRYTMEIRSTATPAPTPESGSMTMTMTAERLGDCPASAQ
ncbi:DUF3617 domain-containing protein [Brevundimonas sp. Root1279]|uniref:DUF3617 domain-containing protein n=1 Tax=Brevundimonas sp. Root1279 TaxID=1736443 RepID=UPI0006FF4B16|nr:DUF3617 family protein [Brevundimonas sp. Root1279]KQW78712.1 hypothetical protein ASC65_15450 [Brevundimonas sp. Root1279]